MKLNNKGLTLIELIFSMILLSIILLFLYGLISNIVLNEKEYVYDNVIDSNFIVERINNDLIKYGLSYTNDINDAVTLEKIDNSLLIKFSTRILEYDNNIEISTITITKNNDNISIQYIDIENKKYTWTLDNKLDIDFDEVKSEISSQNNDNIIYKLSIPVYSKTGTINTKDNNDYKDDIVIEYFGKITKSNFNEIQMQSFADYLIDSGKLWKYGIGYRFIGHGVTCSYNDGAYTEMGYQNCAKLYNYTTILHTEDGDYISRYKYKTKVPESSEEMSVEDVEVFEGTLVNSQESPKNFICFGTRSLSECKKNEKKYLYRIMGVYEDSDKKKYVKLISSRQLGSIAWNEEKTTDTDWEDSTLFKGLNGDLFLDNKEYDYMQNLIWRNKIVDWKWTAVNTMTPEKSRDEVADYYYQTSPQGIYRNEMKTSSSEKGEWTYPIAKIGLLYASDFVFSVGKVIYDGVVYMGTSSCYKLLKPSWLSPYNNGGEYSSYEWTIARSGGFSSSRFSAWAISSGGYLMEYPVSYKLGIRPVFHLKSEVKVSSGTGTYDDPYMIVE